MASILIIRNYERAVAAKSFDELWHRLSNDELFDLRMLFECATGRLLKSSFDGATPEDWATMRRVLGYVERLVRRINSLIGSADWENKSLVWSVLTQAENEDRAANESPEYLGVAHSIYEKLRTDSWWGGGGQTFSDRSLLVFQKVPELPVLDDRLYDVFISYKTSRHADAAQQLADVLIGKGYSVWFDKYVIDRLKGDAEVFETEHLLAILRHGVKNSACTIIFEGELHAGALAPGDNEEDLLKKRQLMRVNAVPAPVIWDWHGIEISAAEWGLAIHPNKITTFHQENGKVLWSKEHPYFSESQRNEVIDAALTAVAGARARDTR